MAGVSVWAAASDALPFVRDGKCLAAVMSPDGGFCPPWGFVASMALLSVEKEERNGFALGLLGELGDGRFGFGFGILTEAHGVGTEVDVDRLGRHVLGAV